MAKIHDEISEGHLEKVIEIVEASPSLDILNNTDWPLKATPALLAAFLGRDTILDYLLDKQVNLYQTSTTQSNLLHMSILGLSDALKSNAFKQHHAIIERYKRTLEIIICHEKKSPLFTPHKHNLCSMKNTRGRTPYEYLHSVFQEKHPKLIEELQSFLKGSVVYAEQLNDSNTSCMTASPSVVITMQKTTQRSLLHNREGLKERVVRKHSSNSLQTSRSQKHVVAVKPTFWLSGAPQFIQSLWRSAPISQSSQDVTQSLLAQQQTKSSLKPY